MFFFMIKSCLCFSFTGLNGDLNRGRIFSTISSDCVVQFTVNCTELPSNKVTSAKDFNLNVSELLKYSHHLLKKNLVKSFMSPISS